MGRSTMPAAHAHLYPLLGESILGVDILLRWATDPVVLVLHVEGDGEGEGLLAGGVDRHSTYDQNPIQASQDFIIWKLRVSKTTLLGESPVKISSETSSSIRKRVKFLPDVPRPTLEI